MTMLHVLNNKILRRRSLLETTNGCMQLQPARIKQQWDSTSLCKMYF